MGSRLLVVGGDGAGMSAASTARRRSPDLEVVAVEAGHWTSYSACGLPYLVEGVVGRPEDLVSRTPEQFRAMRIDVRTGHRVESIDLGARTAEITNLAHGRSYSLGFDLLHLATGGRALRPDVPGLDSPHVHAVHHMADVERLMADLSPSPGPVVVVGGGYIGLEMAEALSARGAEVTVVEAGPEVMHSLDPDMGALVSKALRAMGVAVHTDESLVSVDPGEVTTTVGTIPADVVILGTGVGPDTALAAAAGIELGAASAVAVDRQQRTSVEGVWAAGDCATSVHRVSGEQVHQALGTVANKQGRVAGINISGGYATFPGVLGTAVTRVGDTEIGRTGLGEAEAAAAGFEVVVARIDTTVAAGYMPDAGHLTVKLLAERGTGRLLGVQVVGSPGAAKRVDPVAVALTAGLDAEALVMADLGYAPPVSSLWDPLQLAARVMLERLEDR